MGTIDLPPVEPRGTRTLEQYVQYLADTVAIQQEEILNLLEGRLSSINVREIAGFIVNLTELLHRSKLVGMSAADPTNPDAIRFWAGAENKEDAPFKVRQNGKVEATDGEFTGRISGSEIIGSEIKTNESTYPRAVMSAVLNLFGAYQSATKSFEIQANGPSSVPYLIFTDGDNKALLQLGGASVLFATPIGGAVTDINISSGGTLALSASNLVTFQDWAKMYSTGDGKTLQQELDSIKSRLSALEAAP